MKQYKKFFEFDGVELEFTDEALRAIAEQAIQRGTGARGLRAIMEEVLLNVMYELPSREDVTKCLVDRDVVLTGVNPTLVPRETKKSRRAPAAHRLIALAAATLLLVAVACSTAPTNSSPAQPVGLEGIDWVLDDASLALARREGAPGRPDRPPLRGRPGERVRPGATRYGASFQAIGGTISFGAIRSTAMACEQPVMALESAYLRALEGSTAYAGRAGRPCT